MAPRKSDVKWSREQGWPVPLGILRGGVLLPVVEVLDRWVEVGKWWEGENQENIYFRVEVAGGSVHQVSCPLGEATLTAPPACRAPGKVPRPEEGDANGGTATPAPRG